MSNNSIRESDVTYSLQFYTLLSATDVHKVLKDPDVSFTIFAPNNKAMMSVPKDVILDLMDRSQSTDARREGVVLYHMTQSNNDEQPLTVGDLGDVVLESSATNTPKLFFRQATRDGKKIQFVNGAEIIESIEAENGIIHIIDRFLHEVASKSTALYYITNKAKNGPIETRTSKFSDILKASERLIDSPYTTLNSETALVTVFVPSDRALTSLNTEQMSKLKSDSEGLKKLVSRHIIADVKSVSSEADVGAVWHASLLELERQEALRRGNKLAEIPALEGSITPISVNNELYVSNSCGRVKVLSTIQYNPYGRTAADAVPVVANLTVNNGVIHIVDGLLGYIYNDAYEMIRDDRRVNAMDIHIRKARWENNLRLKTGTVLRPSERLTVFVPLNEAMYEVERADTRDQLKENVTYIREILQKHIIREQFSLTDIKNGSSLQTVDPRFKAHFRQEGDETYVTVDHVEGRIVVPDVCVENGILHYIDVVLGVPYQTVYETVSDRNDLKTLFKNIRRTGLDTLINNKLQPVTFFAPVDTAFEYMGETSVGRTLLGDDIENENKLQTVLSRHAVKGFFFTDEMTSDVMQLGDSQLWLSRQDDGLYIERRGEYQSVTARILEKDIKRTNGALYTIDRVLYENTDEAYRAIPVSAGSFIQSHTMKTILSALILCLFIIVQYF